MKRIFLALLVLLFSVPVFAYNIDNVIINDAGSEQVSVTGNKLDTNASLPKEISGGSVTIDAGYGGRAVSFDTATTADNIYRILLTASEGNIGKMYVGNSEVSANTGLLVTVTGSPVVINVDSFSDVYYSGFWDGDTIYYIIEKR